MRTEFNVSHPIQSPPAHRLRKPGALAGFGVIVALCALACVCAVVGPTAALAQEKPTAATAKRTVQDAQKNKQESTRPKLRPDAVRTLEAITIEGEIAVPQVLFITSRDYPRFRDNLGLKFRISALDVARSVDLPTRLRIVAQHKEEGQ
jgi:hypothetical protein